MELQQTSLFALEIISENSKLHFNRSFSYSPVPSKLYFDSIVSAADLPSSIYYRSISILSYQSCTENNLIERLCQEQKALKCFDEYGETIYYVYYSSEGLIGTLVLAQISFYELCAELGTFQKELAGLALDRVKDIRFKFSLKESAGYYKTYFEQWVELVNSQQREITKLSEDLKNYEELAHQEIDTQTLSRCVICGKNQRNVVFVPCGHVVVCLNCLNDKMDIKLSTLTGKKSMKCVSCKRRIKIAHEVYF